MLLNLKLRCLGTDASIVATLLFTQSKLSLDMIFSSFSNAAISLYKTLTSSEPKTPLPPTVEWLLAHRKPRRAQTDGETPLASLYRMYEYIVLGYNAGLRTELEWFFNHPSWAVASIPDPKDPDPARYAILSVIPHFMIGAINRLVEKGLPRGSPAIICSDEEEEELKSKAVVLETLPSWVAKVPKLPEALIIPNADGSAPEKRDCSPQFSNMNIVVAQPHTLFV